MTPHHLLLAAIAAAFLLGASSAAIVLQYFHHHALMSALADVKRMAEALRVFTQAILDVRQGPHG